MIAVSIDVIEVGSQLWPSLTPATSNVKCLDANLFPIYFPFLLAKKIRPSGGR